MKSKDLNATSGTRFGCVMTITLLVAITALPSRAEPHWASQPQTGIGVNIWAPAWYGESITRFDAEKLADSLHRAGTTVAFTFQEFSQDHQGMSFFEPSSDRCTRT